MSLAKLGCTPLAKDKLQKQVQDKINQALALYRQIANSA